MAKRDFFWFCLLFLHGRRLTQEQAVALRKRLIDILIKRDLLAAKDITNTLLHVVPPRVEGEDGIFIPEDHRRESSDGAYSGETDLVQVPLWGRKFSKRDASALRYALVELMLEFQLMKVKEVAYTFLFVDQAEKDSGGLCWLVIPPTGWQEEKAPDGMFTVAPGSEDEKHMRLNSYRHRKVPHLEVFPRAAEGGFCYLVVPTEAWRSSHGDLEGSFSVGFEVSEKSLAVSPAPQLALEPPHTEAPSAHEGLIATVTPPKPEGHTILIDLSKTDDVLAEAATFLRTRIVGQPKVIKHLLELLVAQRGGLHLGPQPLGQKLFCGLTGIGKTHSAKVFAKLFIGDLGIEDSLTVVKCPEFSDSHNILKLVGAPPSYLGHGNVALLSQLKIDWPQFVLKVGRERVDRIMRDPNIRPRHKWENVETAKLAMLRQLYIENGPYWSVILFDEIEKADPAVHKLLLTILSEGKVAMGDGEVTDFRNSVIIMTSNIGARGIQEMVRGGQPVGFAVPSGVKSKTELDRLIYRKMIAGDKPELEKFFDPEFVGRIRDDIVVLETLSFADYLQVVEVQLAQIALEVTSIFAQKKQVPPVLSFDERFKEFLLKKGLDPRYGARVVAGVAKKKVLDRLSRAIINGELQPGDCILFTYTGDPSDEELNSDLIQLKRAPRTGEQV